MGDTTTLPNGWRLVTIEDAMSAIIDYRGKTPVKTNHGVPLITAKVVKAGRIMEPDEFIAESEYDAWMRRGMVHAGDVVVTTEAPLGEVAQLDDRKVALAQRLIALRGKPEVLDNTFLRFSMQSAFVQDQLCARASGTTVLGIRQSELRLVALPLPPLPTQRAIAGVLGALDDKIEVNRRMARTLEAAARAIFESWFVRFEHPGGDGAAPRLVDSAVGPIPEGWSVGTLGDVAMERRDSIAADALDGSMHYIALEHMPRRSIALADWSDAEDVVSNKRRFDTGDILFGKLRPYFHKVGVAPVSGVCSTDIVVAQPVTPEWFGFVLGVMSSVDFVAHTDRGSAGTKMPRTNWTDMAAYRVAKPPVELASAFTALNRPLVDRIIASIHENRTLSAMRDALLPKLISGELPVPEALGRAD